MTLRIGSEPEGLRIPFDHCEGQMSILPSAWVRAVPPPVDANDLHLSSGYLASQQKWTAEVHLQRYFTLIREISTKRKAHALSQSPFGID